MRAITTPVFESEAETVHSLLWDFDAIAYIAMALAALVIIAELRYTGIERRVRIACMAHVVATGLACIVYFYPTYSYKLLLLGSPWAITAPMFMLLLAIALRTRDWDGTAAGTSGARP